MSSVRRPIHDHAPDEEARRHFGPSYRTPGFISEQVFSGFTRLNMLDDVLRFCEYLTLKLNAHCSNR